MSDDEKDVPDHLDSVNVGKMMLDGETDDRDHLNTVNVGKIGPDGEKWWSGPIVFVRSYPHIMCHD